MRRQSLTVVLCLSVLMVGCKNVDPYIVTGALLDTSAKQFIAIGTAMNEAQEAHAVTDDQYRKWSQFAVKFKVSYRLAVASWGMAVSTKDALAMKNIQDTIRALMTELTEFAPLVVDFIVEIKQ